GDQICRHGHDILINGERVALARSINSKGRFLPVWDGCQRLEAGEYFLLAPHPDSLDGRYLGVTDSGDLDGSVRLLMTFGK
ncbi:MAG: S26 family signal peptidase, partial [Hyphomonas sp.]|uniref:S26 family signal peptidase n=1 Tax=Hyphomonas sp. TaxID=87 RepID=UPI0034A080A8